MIQCVRAYFQDLGVGLVPSCRPSCSDNEQTAILLLPPMKCVVICLRRHFKPYVRCSLISGLERAYARTHSNSNSNVRRSRTEEKRRVRASISFTLNAVQSERASEGGRRGPRGDICMRHGRSRHARREPTQLGMFLVPATHCNS